MPLIDAHCLKKERGSGSIEGLRINFAGVFFAIYFATYSTMLCDHSSHFSFVAMLKQDANDKDEQADNEPSHDGHLT